MFFGLLLSALLCGGQLLSFRFWIQMKADITSGVRIERICPTAGI